MLKTQLQGTDADMTPLRQHGDRQRCTWAGLDRLYRGANRAIARWLRLLDQQVLVRMIRGQQKAPDQALRKGGGDQRVGQYVVGSIELSVERPDRARPTSAETSPGVHCRVEGDGHDVRTAEHAAQRFVDRRAIEPYREVSAVRMPPGDNGFAFGLIDGGQFSCCRQLCAAVAGFQEPGDRQGDVVAVEFTEIEPNVRAVRHITDDDRADLGDPLRQKELARRIQHAECVGIVGAAAEFDGFLGAGRVGPRT
jgi:hypothetical protein